jgi:hypothetical protein
MGDSCVSLRAVASWQAQLLTHQLLIAFSTTAV